MRSLSLLFLTVYLASCSIVTPPDQVEKSSGEESQYSDNEKVVADTYRTIGRIASINREEEFVLVQQYTRSKLEEGSTLSSFGVNGERSNLRVSGEKMGLFSVADIRSGVVQVGDPVQVLVHIKQGKSPTEESPDEALPDGKVKSPEGQLVPKPEVSGKPDI